MSDFAQKFAKQYDIKEYVDKLIDIYKEIIEKKNNTINFNEQTSV